MNNMTPVEFVTSMYEDARWSFGPTPMSIDDAEFNLKSYRLDEIPVPPHMTPRTFAKIWNICYMRDIHGKEANE